MFFLLLPFYAEKKAFYKWTWTGETDELHTSCESAQLTAA